MTRMIKKPSKIELEAAEWALRRHRGLSESEEAELHEWLAVSSRHLGAYARVLSVSTRIDRALVETEGYRRVSILPIRQAPPSRRWFLAASLVAVLGSGGVASLLLRNDKGDSYRTNIGEMRNVLLADGSRMALNTNSQTTVLFSKNRRDIELEQGESVFNVQRDVSRPFIVSVGSLTAKAIGTTFSVRREKDRIDVLVTEGAVEVEADTRHTNGAAGMRLAAGQRVIVDTDGKARIETISSEKAERILAWRNGRLIFNGEQLRDAVAELNRYNHRQIILDDARLADRLIVGSFPVTDIEGFLAALACSFAAQVQHQGNLIRVTSGTSSDTKSICRA